VANLAVHPHWRGEQYAIDFGNRWKSGSSPLAWGTVKALGDGSYSDRFIPTGVGNRNQSGNSHNQQTVHPHWRGEQVSEMGDRFCQGGSSPLAWGTVVWIRSGWLPCRFIPTGVGNSNHNNQKRHKNPVHPHWRGEQGTQNRS